jgi:hypothetical protein
VSNEYRINKYMTSLNKKIHSLLPTTPEKGVPSFAMKNFTFISFFPKRGSFIQPHINNTPKLLVVKVKRKK